MRLRKLERKDAPLMLEWMHDKSVVEHMHADFASKTLDDCIRFIEGSQNFALDCNMAIVDDNDQYLGTVSLKHIDFKLSIAEFGVVIRSCAMGKGVAKVAMHSIMEKGLCEFALTNVYWCVAKNNTRALNFMRSVDMRELMSYQRVS